MTVPGEQVADELQPVVESQPNPQKHPYRIRRALGAVAMAVGFGIVGAGAGLVGAINTAAHLDIAGTPAQVEMTDGPDELSINNNLITLTIPASDKQEVAGQTVGAHLNLDIDPNQFLVPGTDNKFDTQKLTAYATLFSDRKQIVHDIEWSLIDHDLEGAGLGLGLGLFVYGAYRGQRAWRDLQDARYPEDAAAAHRHNARYHLAQRRLAIVLAMSSAIGIAASDQAHITPPAIIHANPAFIGTPLQGAEIGGTLAPGVTYIEKFVASQITSTEKYYDGVTANVQNYLREHPLAIPQGENIHSFIFQTDMHCNTGMGRVIVDTAHHLGLQTIVLGGDNAFSGSFSFEAGCTSGLAELARKYGIKIVSIGGNHDSAMTMAAESKQGILVPGNKVTAVNGLSFVDDSDPRTSRFGEGMRPSSDEAQAKLLTAEAQKVGGVACKSTKPVIAVLHDPLAGRQALLDSCGNVFLALDGHTHVESGPNSLVLPNGHTVYQFTGGSSGGAPAEVEFNESNPLTQITLSNLNHNASFYVMSVNSETGELVAVSGLTITPTQQVSSSQLFLSDTYRSTTEPGPTPSAGQLANAGARTQASPTPNSH